MFVIEYFNLGEHTYFWVKNTLGQFDPVYFLTLYHFKYTYPISLKKIRDVLQTT